MLGQLDRLLAIAAMPRITLGIVPARARYRAPVSNFIMFDDRMVMVETIAAEMTVTQPREIALYGRTFDALAKQAVTGDESRALIRKAIEVRSE